MRQPLEKNIIDVLKYFAYFNYAPSFEEIYTFLPVKTTNKRLKEELEKMVQRGSLICHSALDAESIKIDSRLRGIDKFLRTNYRLPTTIYALPGHGIYFKYRVIRATETRKKLDNVSRYISFVGKLPVIKLIGLSGSCAMGHATKIDDIDLFIIASQGHLWTSRFIALLIAQLMGIRRRRNERKAPGKVCLNLLFDERDVFVTPNKHNLYTAHEILQMKPLVNKDQAYEKFLKVNNWVREYFPNALLSLSRGESQNARSGDLKSSLFWLVQNFINDNKVLPRLLRALAMTIGGNIEAVLKNLQLYFINRNRTTETITDTQLWFFPRDFEMLLRNKGILNKQKN